MIRSLLAACLFAAAAIAVLSNGVSGQPPANKKQPPGKYDPPKPTKPDEATLKVIAEKTEQLRKAVAALKAAKVKDDLLIEVDVYRKAAENIVRFEEWYSKDSGKWALTTLDRGLERAKQAGEGQAPWKGAAGKWAVRAYRSEVDGSIQPYAVLLPHDYGKDPKKTWRLDVVLHGRDSSLTEAKFVATHDSSKAAPKDLGYVQLEVYGRGNNAYRWSGEQDVFEAVADFRNREKDRLGQDPVDPRRIVIRGFSMGGAGTWHIGLHHPGRFCVMGPGAGFTTTHGYISNLPKQLPDYQERCLHVYDAVDYTENAFNIPVVAYSGEVDAQKAAADNIEQLLKRVKEPIRFTHLVAPGLAHQMPPAWQAKAEVEYRKYADKGREPSERVRFVTYTTRYNQCDWVTVQALDRHYDRAVVDARRVPGGVEVTTRNVRAFSLGAPVVEGTVAVDGQKLAGGAGGVFEKVGGKWGRVSADERKARLSQKPEKVPGVQGPIDDALSHSFVVVPPSGKGTGYAEATLKQFAAVWDRYFRSTLPVITADRYDPKSDANLILFGTPETNPLIAKVLPKLPIIWTKDELVVNGVKYDPKTHVPVLIHPNPLNPKKYVVLNSGHTFKEADLKGTNALLYPRLGDWAVVKPTPSPKDPAAYEVVAAGLFDEFWQFPKQ